LIDARIDAGNPRTAGRELPSRQLSVLQVVLFCAASLALFLLAVSTTGAEDALALADSGCRLRDLSLPEAMDLVCHYWLGAVDGLAPVGAWVAITNHLPWEAWLLGAAVALWVAGFDLFYALFDADVDRVQGLHSIVTRFGVRGAFAGARISHAATVMCLAVAGSRLSVASSTGSESAVVGGVASLRALARPASGNGENT